MKKVVSLLLVLCLLLGLTACGNEPVETEDTPTEKKTTTTTAPEESLSYNKIVSTVRQIMKKFSGYSGITNEKSTQRDDGTTARSFKYFDDLFSVTVSLQGDTVTDVIVLSDPNKLAEMNDNPYGVFILVASFSALPFYDESKWDCGDKYTALANALEDTGEPNLENNSVYYRFTEGGWQYVAQCTPLICTFLVSAEEAATTTTANKVTTSQPATKQPTSAQSVPTSTENKPTATKRPTQNKPASTQNKPIPTQNKPTTSTPTQNQDPCAHGHDWKALYDTVHYEEKGHYETVISGYNTVTSYKCAMCYEAFSSLNAYYSHFAQHEASSGSSASFFKERYETVTEQEPIYREEWVVDQEEETVEELIGYECRVCGKKKN